MNNQNNENEPTNEQHQEDVKQFYSYNEQQKSHKTKSSNSALLWKGGLIVSLCILLLIPQFLISNLVNERSARQNEVIEEVSQKWAGNQTISGPIIALPYMDSYLSDKGNPIAYKDFIYIMPSDLKVNGELLPDVRRRTIFNVTVYNSKLEINGSFKNIKLDKIKLKQENILWGEAKLCFGISDKKGMQDKLLINWNGNMQELYPDKEGIDLLGNAFSVPIGLSPEVLINSNSFALKLNLKGAQQIDFVPVGGTTIVDIKSSTKRPSFQGKYLSEYKIGDSAFKKGFESTWKVLDINRAFPQIWKGAINSETSNKLVFQNESFGVKIMSGLDAYAKTQRAVKYAMLVVFLTFLIYFFTEAFEKKYVHPVQYTLVGLALCIFYTLLLSIGEYLGFSASYIISLMATISLIGLYTKSIFKTWKTTLLFGSFLTTIYLFVFVLIQLEDSALLVGSIGLFIILAIIMYLSQKISWEPKNE